MRFPRFQIIFRNQNHSSLDFSFPTQQSKRQKERVSVTADLLRTNMALPNTQPQLPKQGINIGVEAAGEHNVLAKHVAFFDMNNDGIVYPWETFKGFRAIGCGLPLSSFAAVFINMGLSQKTRPGKFPSLRFPIEIKNIAKAKHGSDSGVYDTEGRFVPSKFEEIFKKHAQTTPDALTGEELKELLKANREPKDYGGWIAGYTEWKILYALCKDKDGLLHKDTVKGVYDGSLFEKMASEKASTQKKAGENVYKVWRFG